MTLRGRSRSEVWEALLEPAWQVSLPAPESEDYQAVLRTIPERLRAELKVSDFEQLLRDLHFAACSFAVGRELEPGMLGGTERRDYIKRLHKDVERLLTRLNDLPPALWLTVDDHPMAPEELGEARSLAGRAGVDLEELGELLSGLHELSSAHLDRGLGKPLPGPKLPVHRQDYMRRIIDCWERYTGEPAGYTYHDGLSGVEYTGPFLEFADAASHLGGQRAGFTRRDFVEQIKIIRAGR